jgi:hypothetical protein
VPVKSATCELAAAYRIVPRGIALMASTSTRADLW